MSIVVSGLDLGQAQDYTALVALEAHGTPRKVQWEGRGPFMGMLATMTDMVEGVPLTRLDIRHVERFPLGTAYRTIAEQVEARMRGMPSPRYLAVDETGVGRGVLELLTPLNPIGITITGGQQITRGPGAQEWKVPKRELVAALQVPAQARTIHCAKGLPHAELLVREMVNFKAKISAAGHDSYEAWRQADHDDLVLAAAMAAWAADLIFRILAQRAGERIAWEEAMSSIAKHSISAI